LAAADFSDPDFHIKVSVSSDRTAGSSSGGATGSSGAADASKEASATSSVAKGAVSIFRSLFLCLSMLSRFPVLYVKALIGASATKAVTTSIEENFDCCLAHNTHYTG
jgi:hypothetical protein